VKLFALLMINLAAAASFSCARQDSKRATVAAAADSNARSAPTVSATPTPAPSVDYIPDQFGEHIAAAENIEYTGEDALTDQGYEVEKRVRKIKTANRETEIEYAVLKRNGRVIARFDDKQVEQINEIRFGLCNFLKEEHRQLVVEETANKFWRYWVLRLSPRLEVVYDSGRYDLVYHLRSVDLDGDGRLEIVQNLGSFWYRLGDNVFSPRPEMVFKYDERARRYLPANPEFQSVVLKDIDRRIERVRALNQNNQPGVTDLRLQSNVGDVVIRYLYAGREREAWEFFERDYRDSEIKESARATLKEVIAGDAFYREIRRRPRARRKVYVHRHHRRVGARARLECAPC
jgi:hypothetical protein